MSTAVPPGIGFTRPVRFRGGGEGLEFLLPSPSALNRAGAPARRIR